MTQQHQRHMGAPPQTNIDSGTARKGSRLAGSAQLSGQATAATANTQPCLQMIDGTCEQTPDDTTVWRAALTLFETKNIPDVSSTDATMGSALI